MFERNRVDNTLQTMTVPAEITLADGSVHKGKFVITAARSIYEVLNGETKFLDFETFDGERTLIAKATLASINILTVPSAGGLNARLRDGDQFDPYQVLGLSQGASWDEVRQAYLQLSKIYHPDLYANVVLPAEVKDYLAAIARRLNAAYRALEAPHQAAKRAIIEKAKPVFTSPQRF
ncbi:MAG: J domain-containing protein [Hyphomicrobium sp.]